MLKTHKTIPALAVAALVFILYTFPVFFWGIFAANLIVDVLSFIGSLLVRMIFLIESLTGGIDVVVLLYAILVIGSGLLIAADVFLRMRRRSQ